MLKRVVIKDYRSCRDVEIPDMTPVTALVGRNAAGKTNILRAIQRAARFATSTKATVSHAVHAPVTTVMEVVLPEFACRYSIGRLRPRGSTRMKRFRVGLTETLSVQEPGRTDWSESVRRKLGFVRLFGATEPLRIGAGMPCLPALAALLPEDDSHLPVVRSVTEFLSCIRYYPLDVPSESVDSSEVTGFVDGGVYAEWLAGYSTRHDPGSSVILRILHMYLKERHQFRELTQLLGESGLGLIDGISVRHLEWGDAESHASEVAEPAYSVRFILAKGPGAGDQTLSYAQLSSGTRRILHLLVSLIFDGSSVLLVEHPEDDIHPGLLHKLIGLIKANADPGQVILTSHSPDVFNALSPEEVRLVSMVDGATRVRALTSREITAARDFMLQDGSFSDFLETVQEE